LGLAFQAAWGCLFPAQQTYRDVAQQGEGLRAITLSDVTVILSKGDVQDPMDLVLNAPAAPYRV
jgi:hypothetical protein